MKFTKITEGDYSARSAGYTMDTSADRIIDTELADLLRRNRGDNYVDNLLDELYDFDGPAYRGDDGEIYAVVFVYALDEYRPFCWQRLRKDARYTQYSATSLYDGGWRPWDREQLQAEHDLTDEETDALVEELEELITYRDYMAHHDSENFSWCKPYVSKDGEYSMIVYDGEMYAIHTPDIDAPEFGDRLTDEQMEQFARAVNPDFDLYSGYSCLQIAMFAMQETGCYNCPRYGDGCQTMDEHPDPADHR